MQSPSLAFQLFQPFFAPSLPSCFSYLEYLVEYLRYQMLYQRPFQTSEQCYAYKEIGDLDSYSEKQDCPYPLSPPKLYNFSFHFPYTLPHRNYHPLILSFEQSHHWQRFFFHYSLHWRWVPSQQFFARQILSYHYSFLYNMSIIPFYLHKYRFYAIICHYKQSYFLC